MATNLPPHIVSTILAAFVYRDEGATQTDISAAFADPPLRNTLQGWLLTLVRNGLVRVDARTEPHRYLTTDAGVEFYQAHAAAALAAAAAASPTEPPSGPRPVAATVTEPPAGPASSSVAASVSEQPTAAGQPAAGATSPSVAASPTEPPAGPAPSSVAASVSEWSAAAGRPPSPAATAATGVPPPAVSLPGGLDAGRAGRLDAGMAATPANPAAANPPDPTGNGAASGGKTAATPAVTSPAPVAPPDGDGAVAEVGGAAAGAASGAAGHVVNGGSAGEGGDANGFKPLFDGLVPQIVIGVLPHASALALLQTWPVAGLAEPARRGRFVQYGMEQLSHLTLGECMRLGIQPGQYELWRRQYFVAPESPSGASAGPTPAAGPATAGTPTDPPSAKPARPHAGPAAGSPGTADDGASPAGNGPSATHAKPAATPAPPSEAELVASVVTPLLAAVLPATSTPSATGHGGPWSPALPAGGGGMTSNPASRAAANATARGLSDWLGHRAGLPPAIQGLILLIGTAVVGWLLSLVATSPLLGLGIAAAVIAGWLIWRRLSSPPAPAAGAPAAMPASAGQPSSPAAASPAERPASPAPSPVAASVSEWSSHPASSPVASSVSEWSRPSEASPPRPRFAFRISRLWSAAVVLVAVAILAGVLWYRLRQRPSATTVRDYLVQSVAPLPVRVVALTLTYGPTTATGCPVTYQVRFETTEPLFRPVDPTEYLRVHAVDADQGPGTKDQRPANQTDPVSSAAANGSANPPSVVRPPQLLVTTATPPGAAAFGSGSLTAWRSNGVWVFTPSGATLDRTRLVGEPKPAGALAVDLPADAARLNAWVAEQVAAAARAREAAAAAAADQERFRQQQTAAFGQQLRPGTLFTGTITDPIRGAQQRVIVELTGATGAQLTAVLRNDGGWSDTRRFTGDWVVTPAADAAVVTLRTSRADAVADAGPLLDDRLDWALILQLGADGSVSAPAGPTVVRTSPTALPVALRRVDPAAAEDVRADVLRPLSAAVAATRPGAVYRGTALSKVYRTTEELVLRFGGNGGRSLAPLGTVSSSNPPIPPGSGSQPASGPANPASLDPLQPGVLVATLASAAAPERVRRFSGELVSSTYRVGDRPVWLRSEDAQRVPGADPRSPLGLNTTNNSLVLALRVSGAGLVGEDARFTYTFAAAADQGPATEPRDQGPGDQTGPAFNPASTSASNGSSNPASNPVSNGASNPASNPASNGSAVPSSAVRPSPAFPTAAGAYGLVGGEWVALPHNAPQAIRKGARPFDAFFSSLEALERRLAGKELEPASEIWGALTFDGGEPVPWLPAEAAVVIYVGEIAPLDAKLLKKYPTLKLEPLIELARLETLDSGSRSVLLSTVVPGIAGFGPRRIAAEIDGPAPRVTRLRCPAPLLPGRYALMCNDQQYELGALGQQ